jgi:hypothetical protein
MRSSEHHTEYPVDVFRLHAVHPLGEAALEFSDKGALRGDPPHVDALRQVFFSFPSSTGSLTGI